MYIVWPNKATLQSGCHRRETCKNDEDIISLDENAKTEAQKVHYERLLIVDSPWNPEEDLSVESSCRPELANHFGNDHKGHP